MRRIVFLCCMTLMLAGAALAGAPARVAAHNAYPATQYPLQFGPYRYQALLYNQKVNAGDHVQILLVPDSGRSSTAVHVTVQAIGPGGLTVPATIVPDENNPDNPAVDLIIPRAGSWRIVFTLQGPRGAGSAEFSVAVAPAPALPPWAGWVIALSPLLGVAWFAFQQRGLLRRAQLDGLRV